MFAFIQRRGPVDVAFTDRHGGVSGGPYASLNLAANGSEHADTVAENLDILAHAFARGHEAASPDRSSSCRRGSPCPGCR